jgi:3-oxo-5-alpha-steroid 4-dehydrogenase 3
MSIFASKENLENQTFSAFTLILVLVLIFAFYVQHDSLRILASLRNDRDPSSVGIPFGGAFKYVSCPHFTTEVIIYAAFALLDQHILVGLAFIFTLINQILSALVTHSWYRKTFQIYPKDRKAIFPYIL